MLKTILSALGEPAQAGRRVKPKYRVVSTSTVPHFYGGRVRKARKIIRLHGAHKAMELHPELADVKVKEVRVSRIERIDRSRYTGEVLRKLRSERGVGRAR